MTAYDVTIAPCYRTPWCDAAGRDEIVTSLLVTGQLTLEPDRLENGNIGNAYVVVGLFSSLRKAFPRATIRTTLQVSKRLQRECNLEVLPPSVFMNPHTDSLESVRRDTGPWESAVRRSDVVLDVSGDMWGPNADLISPGRFVAGLERIYQSISLGIPTMLVASSPGPFSEEDDELKSIARQSYGLYSAVVNREPASTRHLAGLDFDMTRTHSTACPSWLYTSSVTPRDARRRLGIEIGASVLAVAICGWNFRSGSFGQTDRALTEYLPFAVPASQFAAREGLDVVVLSHSNGFTRQSEGIVLNEGRDAVHAERLTECFLSLGTKNVTLLRGPIEPQVAHSFLGSCSYVVSGRLHGAVAALSAGVPTVCLDYGIGPQNLKSLGFMELVGCEDFIVSPEADAIASALDLATDEDLTHRITHKLVDVRTAAANTWKTVTTTVGSS